MRDNKQLKRAKDNKNDEFYTRIEDIGKELKYYKPFLKGKSICCPCDSEWSNFYKYFKEHAHEYYVKEVVCIGWDGVVRHISPVADGDNIVNKWQIVKDQPTLFDDDSDQLGAGSFYNSFVEDIIKKCDVVITNPPFSIEMDLYKIILRNKKDYIIVGVNMMFGYKPVMEQIVKGKCYLGNNEVVKFKKPNGDIASVRCWWYTSFKIHSTKPHISPVCALSEEKHKKYDSYTGFWCRSEINELNPYKDKLINIDSINDYPVDWDGFVGVPINMFGKYDMNDFKIFDCISPKINKKDLFKRVIVKYVKGGDK